MTPRCLTLGMAALVALGGCAAGVKHEINVSPKLRELPVHSVCVVEPVLPEKTQRRFPDQLPEMTPERRAESATAFLAAVTSALGASLAVDSSCIATEDARAWTAAITEDLVKGRVPLGVKPYPVPVESVLLVGVQVYGTENTQTQVSLLWLKPWRLGKPSFDHRVLFTAILVKPQTGEVLFDAQHEEIEVADQPSPELLNRVATRAAGALLEAFFPKPK